jgi:hypothetical protein
MACFDAQTFQRRSAKLYCCGYEEAKELALNA